MFNAGRSEERAACGSGGTECPTALVVVVAAAAEEEEKGGERWGASHSLVVVSLGFSARVLGVAEGSGAGGVVDK